jgi:hypothetical protein
MIGRNTQKSQTKAKVLLLQKGMQLTRSMISKHTKCEVHAKTQPCSSQGLVHHWVHNSLQLAIVCGKGSVDTYS